MPAPAFLNVVVTLNGIDYIAFQARSRRLLLVDDRKNRDRLSSFFNCCSDSIKMGDPTLDCIQSKRRFGAGGFDNAPDSSTQSPSASKGGY